MDDEQIFMRDTRNLRFEVQKNRISDIEPLSFSPVPRVAYSAGPGNVMRRSVGFDSSKRAGIRYHPGFNCYCVLIEGGMRRGR